MYLVKKYVLPLLLFLILATAVIFLRQKPKELRYIAEATGNPGEILLYVNSGQGYKLAKTIETGYQLVHTVRIGDIYNNGTKYIIAGVSNSFLREPYGCKVVAYDLEKFNQTIIDDVGDLRCKDLTIGDVDTNGKNAIVLATHGEGIVRVYRWLNNVWQKETLETNFIAQIDKGENTNHKVPNTDVPCKTCLIQTAVHIVKVGDVDNDGKNEIVATMSSPLELLNVDEISFIRIYKKVGDKWEGKTIDTITGKEFRSVTIDDIYGTGKNTLLVGIGSPRNEPGSLIAYQYGNGNWEKSAVYDDKIEKNMKGVAFGEINPGEKSILLATGFPDANIMTFRWNGTNFDRSDLGSVRSLINLPDAQFNSMAAIITNDVPKHLIIVGSTVFPKQKIGWEATDKGYLIDFIKSNGKWTPTIIDSHNVLGLDSL
jgi:hypothetical protein